MFTDPKADDYLAWLHQTDEQDRGQFTHFEQHRGTSESQRIRQKNSSSTQTSNAAARVGVLELDSLPAEAPVDIVDLIQKTRNITDRELPFIGRRSAITAPQQFQSPTSLEAFVGGIAHHFNNLFMAMQGYVSLVALDTEDNHPHAERLKRIEKLIHSESMLTNDLLGIVFGRGCRISNHRQTRLLKEIIKISDYLEPVDASDHIEVSSHPTPDLPEYALRRLCGSIACIINRLLAEIQEHAVLMIAQTDWRLPPYEWLMKIEKHVQEGFSLIRDLFNYAGSRTREQNCRLHPQQLTELALETYFLREEKYRLHVDVDRELSIMNVNGRQMATILQKLYDNAAEAMIEGGEIFLSAKNIPPEEIYEFGWNVPARLYVQLTVRDTGRGIDASVLKRIFEPFFTTKGFANHHGLGLSSVYGLVKSIDGSIAVSSNPGMETAVRVYLPAIDSAGSKYTGAKLRVKISDNNQVIHLGKKRKSKKVKYH
jgi:signal transduction histidine kinase